MLNWATRLVTCRPSPTTVSFEVSNAPCLESWTWRTVFYASILLRLLAGSLCVAFLLLKYQYHNTGCAESWYGSWIQTFPAGFQELVAGTRWPVFLVLGVAVLFLCLRRYHTGRRPQS